MRDPIYEPRGAAREDGRWIYQNGFAIAMLDGWEQSRGARIEHNLAKALGIECRPWMEWL